MTYLIHNIRSATTLRILAVIFPLQAVTKMQTVEPHQ